MKDLLRLMEDIATKAFEDNVRLASLAVLTFSGEIIYQTKNWDLSTQSKILIEVVNGKKNFVLNSLDFVVVKNNAKGIVAINEIGMGSIIIIELNSGLFTSYIMPGGNPDDGLSFLSHYVQEINECISR